MDVDTIKAFLRALGCDSISVTDDWVNASCPFARWRHSGGVDSNPSFGVAIGESPSFNCFACSSSGNLIKLLHALQLLSGENYSDAWAILIRSGVVDVVTTDGLTVRQSPTAANMRHRKIPVKVPSEVLQGLPLLTDSDISEVHTVSDWLLGERGISMQAIAQSHLRLYNHGGLGVIFPIMTHSGDTYDMFVRMIDSKKFFRLSPNLVGSDVLYSGSGIWFGSHILDIRKPVLMVEGALDALKVHSLGMSNTIASMGTPSRQQLMSAFARCVYLGFDADEAGRAMISRATKVLLRRVPYLYIVDWGSVGVKDAGELESAEQLDSALKSAKLLMRPLRRI